MLTEELKPLALDSDRSLTSMLFLSETSLPLLETLKDELLLLETSKSEMDGLLDIRPTRLPPITLLLTPFTLEEMLPLDLELFIPMDRTSLTLELKKESSLEETSTDPLTYLPSLPRATETLLAKATLPLLSPLLKLATLNSKPRLARTLITSVSRSNGPDST